MIEDVMAGVLEEKKSEGSGFEEKGKGRLSHTLGGQSLRCSCKGWDPWAV